MGTNIGIDFGTTNTLVSYVNKKGKVVNYRTDEGSEIIPSAVFFQTKYEDDWIIGDEAKQNILIDPQAGVENFKSLLGKKNYMYSIIAENGDIVKISPREVTRFFIAEVLRMVEESFLEEFDGDDRFIGSVVISVPAKFNYIERGAIKRAVMDANIDDDKVRIVPESTAAAYAHINLVEKKNKPETILVYDFGGGTFDVSLLKVMKNGTYSEVVVPGGDKNLGGNKLTENIVKEIIDMIEEEYEYYIPLLDVDDEYNEQKYGMSKEVYAKNLREIFNVSNRIKELSSKNKDDARRNYVINLKMDDDAEQAIEISYSKQEVDQLIQDDINRTIKITLKMLEEAKAESINTIDSVVIAGGSSNITMVKKELEQALNMEITRADNVTTLISRGAALFAQESFERDLNIVTQTNTEIGIKAKVDNIPNAFVPVILSGVNLPTENITKKFNLMSDGQRNISFEIYERDVKNYPKAKRTNSQGVTWVDKFVVENLPENLNKEDVAIELTFAIDSEGTMDVRAVIKDIEGYVIENADITVTVESNVG